MRTSLLYERLEAPLAPLERLPRGLWLWSLVHSQGRLVPRLAGIAGLRGALLEGHAAATADANGQWPPPPLADHVAVTLETADLPRHCEGEPALTETVLRSLCFHLDMIVDYRDRGDSEEEAATRTLEAFAADWKDRCGTMDELSAIFGEYADLVKNSRWDMMRGLLRSGGWQEVIRARRLIEALPELARIVRQLGRARETDEMDTASHSDVRVMEEHLAMREVVRIVQVPDYPGETLGVRRSGRVARMLPAEAMALLHPRLRLVWHARHAERTLLSYQDDDRMPDVKSELAPAWRPSARRVSNKRREMGPMLVCVDTSGSMQGGAEAVAKAVVLESVRTAHAHVAVARRVHLVRLARPAELAHDTRELGQCFDQAAGANHLLPAAAAQQPAHHVPARVLHQVGVFAEDRRQLVHRAAAVLPVRGESLQRPRRGLLLAVAPVPVVDDHVQVEAERAQHRLGEGRLAFAVARQVGRLKRHCHVVGQGRGRPLPIGVGGGGGVTFEQRPAQACDARQSRHQPPLRMDQAPQPQAPRQALQRRQRRFEALVEQRCAHGRAPLQRRGRETGRLRHPPPVAAAC